MYIYIYISIYLMSDTSIDHHTAGHELLCLVVPRIWVGVSIGVLHIEASLAQVQFAHATSPRRMSDVAAVGHLCHDGILPVHGAISVKRGPGTIAHRVLGTLRTPLAAPPLINLRLAGVTTSGDGLYQLVVDRECTNLRSKFKRLGAS